jgi:hypothetical protein
VHTVLQTRSRYTVRRCSAVVRPSRE